MISNKKYTLFWSLVALCILPLFTSCTTTTQTTTPIVVDTGVWSKGGRNDRFGWIDSDTLIYMGSETLPVMARNADMYGPDLMLFNVSNGKRKMHFANVAQFCYREGRLLVNAKIDGEIKMLEGSLDSLNEYTSNERTYWERANCEVIEVSKQPGNALGRRWVVLPKNGGYLDIGTLHMRPNQPVRYLENNKTTVGTAAQLGITSEQFPFNINYHSPSGKYLFVKHSEDLQIEKQTKNCFKNIYWFSPPSDFQPAKVYLPCGTPKNLFWSVPVHDGSFVSVTHLEDIRKGSAMYMSKGKEVVELLRGRFNMLSVSPNGCRVAAIHAPELKYVFAKQTIKLIDFCNKG